MSDTEKTRNIEITVKLTFAVNGTVPKRNNRNTRLDIEDFATFILRDNQRVVSCLLEDYDVISVEDLPV